MTIRPLLLLLLASSLTAQINLYSIGRETELGLSIADSLRAKLKIIDDPQVSRIAAMLAPHAGGPFDCHVLVFDDTAQPISPPPMTFPRHPGEPLAVAGGWIFLPSSLATRAAGEPQLAAILAHSMAHIALRHATRMATRRDLIEMSVDVLPDRIPAIVPVSMTQGLPLALAAGARSFELHADALAITILKASGYDPHALTDYIRTLPAEHPRASSSMPDPAIRIARIEAALTSPPTPARPDPRL